ncbi:MAG: hotdog domain-containing protein [Spirochaetota bacterium]
MNEHDNFMLVTQHLVMKEHLNPNNVIFGGQLLAWLDVAVYIHVSNKMRYKSMVTGSMNNVRFRSPAYLGDIVQIYARIKNIKKTSVTAEGKAVAYYTEENKHRDIIECQISYVAVNEKGRPVKAFTPQGEIETERRNSDSEI